MKLISNEMNRDSGACRKPLLAAFAVLALASHGVAAVATSVTASMTSTSPGGFIFDGTSNWVSDEVQGLCQMDPAGRLTNTCITKPSTTTPGVTPVLGQPAFDAATNSLYVPDMSTASKGIWRYSFTGRNFSNPVNIAAAAGLGAQRPGAVAMAPDGSLIVSMAANSSIMAISTPSAAAQTVTKVGTTLSGNPAAGIAMVGTQLWIADTKGILLFADPVNCGGKCRGSLILTFGIAVPSSIAFDTVNSLVYIGTSAGVFRSNRLTGLTDLYTEAYTKAGVPGLFSDVTAVGVNGTGVLFIVDDPTAGQVNGQAAIFTVPANSAPVGQGSIPTPPSTIPPTVSLTAVANPGSLFSSGLPAPVGAVFLPNTAGTGGHIWIADSTLGFCKVVPTLPAPSLTACAVLPAGFVAGEPAFGAGNVYLADTSATGGILRFAFNSTTETLGAGATVVSNAALIAPAAGATAPSALTFGPDGNLYVAMAGTTSILRITTPVQNQHTVLAIGSMAQAGSVSISFFGAGATADLYDAEATNVSFINNATLCKGTCVSQFVPVTLSAVTAVASDAKFLYIGEVDRLWRFDPVLNVLQVMADTGLLANGTTTPFNPVTGIAIDNGRRRLCRVDGRIWKLSTAAPAITSLSPNQAPESSTKAIVITGSNFTAPLTVNTCPAITPSLVSLVSSTQISATFSINPLGPLGACAVTVITANGTSAAATFTVLIGPPFLGSITPSTGFRGRTVPISIVGANMTSGTLSPIPDITFAGTVVTDTLLTSNFAISGTAPLGTRNVIVTTPSGPSNTLLFTVAAAPPVLTSITPAQGVAATTVPVTIAGTDLLDGTLNLPAGFTVSGVPVVTPTSIAANLVIASTVPSGLQNITVTTTGGTSNAVTFRILPALTSIVPATAKAGTATSVTLNGTSLNAVTAINAGANIAVSLIVPGLNTVTATFTTLASAPLGPQSVTVTDANGTSNAVTFTITAPTPTLATIVPATGATGTTVPVTITGTGLVGATLNLPAGITLSGTPVVTFSQITANLVIAATNIAPVGPANITVTTPGGTSNAVSFTIFVATPVLTSINPTQGVAAATVPVTFTGTALVGAALNLPAGFTLSGVPVVTATSITANLVIASTVPSGLQSITVTTPGGTSNAVTFRILPSLTSIAPNTARAGTATAVTLNGAGLNAVTSINAGANITVSNVVIRPQPDHRHLHQPGRRSCRSGECHRYRCERHQ